jgi:hypothetical protein
MGKRQLGSAAGPCSEASGPTSPASQQSKKTAASSARNTADKTGGSTNCSICEEDPYKPPNAPVCKFCGTDCTCTSRRCWVDAGTFCGVCDIFCCAECADTLPAAQGGTRSCDDCLEIYCAACGGFKPKDGLNERCVRCQAWWQRRLPATEFCKECGEHEPGARACERCGSRICGGCPSQHCTECGRFFCDMCPAKGVFCKA